MTRTVLLLAAALLLASCGRQGDLARPGPLFGRGGETQAPAQPSAATQGDQEGDAVEGTGTRNATDLDPHRTLDPASSAPLEGVSNDPVGDRPPVSPRG
jgi:Prokaryotic lipoprotein-attachment site